MSANVESIHPAELVLAELDNFESRLEAWINDGDLVPGTVLGRIAAFSAADGNTGGGTVATISFTAACQLGAYRCVATTAGATALFNVFDPNGNLIGVATTGTEFSVNGAVFTITDGTPDFAVGDVLLVHNGFAIYDQDASDNSEEPIAVLLSVESRAAGQGVWRRGCVLYKDARVRYAQLVWNAAMDPDEAHLAIQALLANGIRVAKANVEV